MKLNMDFSNAGPNVYVIGIFIVAIGLLSGIAFAFQGHLEF